MKRIVLSVTYVVLTFLWGHPEVVFASMPLKVTVTPNQILIGASYNGATISVMGEIPADSEALVRVMGHLENNRLKKKGRALGILWMNLGAVEFQNVPSVFLIYPSNGVNEFLHAEQHSWQGSGLGLEAVQKQANIVSGCEDKEALFEEFVKLKKKFGLYDTVEDAIRYKGGDGGGMKSFSCTLALPSALPQGGYKLDVFAVKDGDITGYATDKIEAKEVGMPALISSLAFNHGTIYGILSVIVAIVAGLLTGVIFRGGEGAH